MRRFSLIAAAFSVGLALSLYCYREALFSGAQFAYRDAGHFYYPLYLKVQQEWEAGRWPLWSIEENAGIPLLGNPTAAVLYPGKLIYTALPYPWAARIYTVFHTLLAFAGMLRLGRHWRISWIGSTIAALGYAFGAPILFQYCNIIFLVGAAWLPFGIQAIDAWLREKRRIAIAQLAAVLALQVLGGDPQTAYVLGLCSLGYAIALSRPTKPSSEPLPRWFWPVVVLIVVLIWTAITLWAASVLPAFRPPKKQPNAPWRTFIWNDWIPLVVNIAWGIWGLFVLNRWRRKSPLGSSLGKALFGLGLAGALAGGLCAAQMLPVLEFTGISARSTTDGPHDYYPFSLEPYRIVELAWPDFFGKTFGHNHLWLNALPPQHNHRIWIPSLYMGGFSLILACTGFGLARRKPWLIWLSAITVVSLLASFGEFASPLWWARWSQTLTQTLKLGPHDPVQVTAVREDAFLRDGDGSPYFLLATVFPGFRSFRYPSKLLTFTIFGLAVLAGAGWDELQSDRGRRARRAAALILIVSLVSLVSALTFKNAIIQFWVDAKTSSPFGPLDTQGAFGDVTFGFVRGILFPALFLILVRVFRNRPQTLGITLVLLLAIDLGWANGPSVRTVAQSEFEKTPRVLQLIAEAEKENPAPGPYRIHRQPIWNPYIWTTESSEDRVKDFVIWERDTIQPKYALPFGVEYTQTQGTAELFDYEWFFGPFKRIQTAQNRDFFKATVAADERVVVYPRRGFDLWNTRYFVIPAFPRWTDGDRGIASFLPNAVKIYPKPKQFEGPDAETKQRYWLESEDFQIYRNEDAYPRAWVVHSARILKPIVGLAKELREQPMEEILFQNDIFWSDSSKIPYDPRNIAWVETDEANAIARTLSRVPTSPSEAVKVRQPNPQRTELEVELKTPGIVILADVFYPGWSLTVDGQPAEILRVNRMMRGAMVSSGKHTLVYQYEPRSFRVGLRVTLGAILALILASAWGFAQDRKARAGNPEG